MEDFFSEESIRRHREYARDIRLKYSILEKSIKGLKGKNIREIIRQRMNKQDKDEAVRLLGEALAHELFFTSFSPECYKPCPPADIVFGSTAAMLNEIYKRAMNIPIGYVAVIAERGLPMVISTPTGYELFLKAEPILVVDVCEHAYFYDYGFDKSAYLIRALPYLNLDKISEFDKIG